MCSRRQSKANWSKCVSSDQSVQPIRSCIVCNWCRILYIWQKPIKRCSLCSNSSRLNSAMCGVWKVSKGGEFVHLSPDWGQLWPCNGSKIKWKERLRVQCTLSFVVFNSSRDVTWIDKWSLQLTKYFCSLHQLDTGYEGVMWNYWRVETFPFLACH